MDLRGVLAGVGDDNLWSTWMVLQEFRHVVYLALEVSASAAING